MTRRWLKFSAVGLVGVGVQLAVLALLTKLGVHYLVATAFAVEMALLHNYAWHRRWTWADRHARSGRLLRFHLANGLVSLVSNLVWMRVLTGALGVPPVPANLAAITVTSLLNFALAERWVFTRSAEGARGRVEGLLQGVAGQAGDQRLYGPGEP